MKSLIPLFILLLSFTLLPPAYAQKTQTVEKVLNGNTIVLIGGEVVSLIGVEAPKFPKKGGSHSAAAGWATRSEEFLKGLVMGRPVWLEYDSVKKNPVGQTLAYVFFKLDSTMAIGGGGEKPLLTNGTYMANRLMVQYGMASAGAHFSFKYQSQFKQMEAEARMNQVGLWQQAF